MIKDKSRSYSASKSEPIILQNLLAAIKYRHLAQFAAVDQNITDEQIQVNTAIVRRQVWREMKGRERGGGGGRGTIHVPYLKAENIQPNWEQMTQVYVSYKSCLSQCLVADYRL